MPKVKMSDVKSGSENVKNLFRRNMSERTLKWIQKQTYTNSELIEILTISQNIERHKDHRFFYQMLIDGQKGPFNNEVFVEYRDILFHTDALLNLIYNSQSVSDDDKAKWIDYSFVTSYYWFLPNFYMNGDCKKVGIDLMRSPFNMSFAQNAVRYSAKLKRNMEANEKKFIWDIIDTLTDAEKMEWYVAVVAQTYEKTSIDMLAEYPNTTGEILRMHYARVSSFDSKGKLVLHKNCPPELRAEMYSLTQDDKYLPEMVKDIFLF